MNTISPVGKLYGEEDRQRRDNADACVATCQPTSEPFMFENTQIL